MENLIKVDFKPVPKKSLTYSKRKTLKKYTDLLNKDVWTKTEIQSFKNFVNSAQFERDELYKAAKNDLWAVFSENHIAKDITKEQTDFGIQWLKDFLFKKNGQPRNSKPVQNFGRSDFETVLDFERFTFIGYHVVYNNYSGHAYIQGPVYRVISKSGSFFDYCVTGLWENPIIDDQIAVNG